MTAVAQIDVAGDSSSGARAWQALAAEIERMDQKLKTVGQTSQKVDTQSKSLVQSSLAGFTRMAAGAVSVRAAIGFMTTAMKEYNAEVDAAALKEDARARKFQVQAGLTAGQSQAAQLQIGGVATKNAIPLDKAAAAATQLVSSGFSTKDATGGALDILLQTLQASNLGEGDPTQLTQALGQFLAAQGLDKNTANLTRVAVGTQRLFKGTDLQLSDLTALAGKSQGLAGKLSPEEVLATFDVLREKTGADRASTALQIIGQRLTGAAGDKERVTQLKKLGLKPGDVDFAPNADGSRENIQQVLAQLGGGLDKLPEAQRTPLLQRLFGTEAAGPAADLIANRGKVGTALKTIGDQAGFAEDVAIGTSGKNAGMVRLQNQRELRKAEADQNSALTRQALANELEKRGSSPARVEASLLQFDTARGFGAAPETAVGIASALGRGGIKEGGTLAEDVGKAVAAALRGSPIEVKVEAPKDRAKVPGVVGLDRRAR